MTALEQLQQDVTDLNGKIDAMQIVIDQEQADIAALLANNAQVVTDLNAQIAALNEQIANGATPAQLTAISTELATIAAKVDAASTDVAGTV